MYILILVQAVERFQQVRLHNFVVSIDRRLQKKRRTCKLLFHGVVLAAALVEALEVVVGALQLLVRCALVW